MTAVTTLSCDTGKRHRELTLAFKTPFAWDTLLRFIETRASAGVEAVERDASDDIGKSGKNKLYRRAIEWHGDEGILTVARHPEQAQLIATFHGPVARHADEIVPRLRHMFDLDADPDAIHATLSQDPWLAPLLEATPGLRVPGTWSTFELVVRTIVGQQVSVKAATTVMGRIVERTGQPIAHHPHAATAWRFPTPEALATANLEKIGMPGSRVRTIQGFAQTVANGALSFATSHTHHVDSTLAREALLSLPGIGPWTVEYVAMRALRDADAWPATDLVLMQAILQRDPSLLKAKQQQARSDAWRPYRAYAAMHLWHAFTAVSGKVGGG